MRYHRYLITLAAVLLFAGHAVSAEPIRMGYFNLPPHQYKNNGDTKPRGASVIYFESLASEMGYEVEWIGPLPLLRLSLRLKDGTVDGTVGFNRFPELEQFLYYPDTHMFLARPIFIVRKENPLRKLESADDIRGWKIGLIATISGTYTPMIDENRDIITLEKLGGDKWAFQNIGKLFAGRVDAVFGRNQYTLPFVAARMNLSSQIRTLFIPDPPTPMYVAFSKASKRGKTLAEKCNAAMSHMNLNYDELAQKEIEAVIPHT